jgi:transposase-like protein
MHCPRCGAELEEHEPAVVWLRHWTCPECWSAWRYGPHGLEHGRTKREVLGQTKPVLDWQKIAVDQAKREVLGAHGEIQNPGPARVQT